jgi:hypothetical protein
VELKDVSGYGITMQEHRMDDKWACDVCGKVIYGKRNTIHLGIIAHFNKEWKLGLRKEPYDPFNRLIKE